MLPNPIGGVLVVDDDACLRRTLSLALADFVKELRLCGDAASSIGLLETWRPEFVLLDVALPDGSAFDVLRSIHRRAPTPRVVAMSGVATAEESFRLAQLGVGAFISKPFDTGELVRAMECAADSPLDLRPQVRNVVGLRSVRDIESEIRSVMLEEALARSRGNRRRAARLLGMSRQLLQYLLRCGAD